MWWHRQNHGFRMSLEVNFNVGFDDLRPAGEEKGQKIAPIGQIKSQEKNIIRQIFFLWKKMVLGRSGKSGLAFM